VKPLVKRIVIGIPIVAAAIQLIPVPRVSPPVTREVRWDAPATRALAQRACFDCHSNLTTWPWYSRVAPVSWLVANHVNDGRRRLNFSEWDRPQREALKDVDEAVTSGDMPIWNYVMIHPEAKLSDVEKAQLVAGLRATFLQDPPTPAPSR
jgi:hypothetical protein